MMALGLYALNKLVLLHIIDAVSLSMGARLWIGA